MLLPSPSILGFQKDKKTNKKEKCEDRSTFFHTFCMSFPGSSEERKTDVTLAAWERGRWQRAQEISVTRLVSFVTKNSPRYSGEHTTSLGPRNPARVNTWRGGREVLVLFCDGQVRDWES